MGKILLMTKLLDGRADHRDPASRYGSCIALVVCLVLLAGVGYLAVMLGPYLSMASSSGTAEESLTDPAAVQTEELATDL